jgi:hypothetical protein
MRPIIDFHAHVLSKYSDWYEETHALVRRYNPAFYAQLDFFLSPVGVLADMDRCGIARACMIGDQAPDTHGVIPNDFIIEFSRSSERFLPFVVVNPNAHSPAEGELERFVKAGARVYGVKLTPPYNFYEPADPRLDRVYGMAQDLSIPALFHTGGSVFPNTQPKFGNPLLLEGVARKFPRLNIVMAHGGRPKWYAEADNLVLAHPNFYIDISGLPPKNLLKYFPNIPRFPEKYVFGSDWPVVPDRKENIETLETLGFSDEALDMILFGNAQRLLGI